MVLPALLVHGLIALTASAQTQTSDLIRAEEQSRLSHCLELQQEDAEAAYEDGLAWLMEGNRPAARYCTATALIELGKFAEGASRLETLATAPDGGSMADRAIYMAQAGNAWMLARLPEAAIVAFDESLRLDAYDAEVYLDRARAYLTMDKWSEAEADLDASLGINPGDIQAYILRGRARLEQGKLDGAMSDVEQARGIDGANTDALLLRGEVRQAKWALEDQN